MQGRFTVGRCWRHNFPARLGGTGRLHIPCCDNRGMTTQDVIDQAVALTYRLSGYVLLNLADEAAILALVFC